MIETSVWSSCSSLWPVTKTDVECRRREGGYARGS